MLYKNVNLFKVSEDSRGEIFEVLGAKENATIRNINYITGKAGAIRGQHSHKKDTHYCLVIGGRIEYSWVRKGEKKVQSMILESGQMVLSEVGEQHKFTFLTDGIFLDFNTEARTPESYEKDTHRAEF